MYKRFLLLLLAGALTWSPQSQAAETPETVLIRRALDNVKFGYRRADLDLALSAFAPQVVVYEGNSNADPRGWTVRYESHDAFVQALTADLAQNQYELERSVPSIHVAGAKALVTTIDSGRVVNRQDKSSRPLYDRRLWTFVKQEDAWLATSFVQNLGDSTLAAQANAAADGPVAQILEEERKAWEDGRSGSITDHFDEDFSGYAGAAALAPASWTILFQDIETFKTWTDKRLQFTDYALQRQMLYAHVGSQGQEAIALTRDKVSTSYKNGPAAHAQDRYVLWTLSRRSGSWKITNMVYDIGLQH
ncbi:MAG: hypothetical protein GKR89_01595 [Candidatus Latescibacteria bacterium]|nr:hypothetical protein [Candidatus Latescibacterota bacterium]